MTMVKLRPTTYTEYAAFLSLTVPRYLEMVKSGFIDDDDKIELLEGYLVLKMSRNPPHDSSLQKLQRAVNRVLPTGWDLRQQSGVRLDDSVPEPDLAVVRGEADDYATRHPRPAEVGLLVEVADTSLARDTQDKPRIYARAGIVIYWVVDLVNRRVIVFTEPSGPCDDPAYAQRRNYLPGEAVPFVLDGVTIAEIAVNDLLPANGRGPMKNPIVGLGEILWDFLPDGPQLGGAPFNFTFHCHQLDWPAVIVSRIGNDTLGDQIEDRLADLHLDAGYLQIDAEHATGRVTVALDATGQPAYTIHEDAAWDHLTWEDALEPLLANAAAVCFGSLLQRGPIARATLLRLLAIESPAIRIFDVNLRQNFWTREVIEKSLRASDWVKLNVEELHKLDDLFDFQSLGESEALAVLRERYDLDLVCLTRGADGCLVMTADEKIEEPGVAVQVVDTIGAGDAFTAGLVVGVLEGRPLRETVQRANQLAARVAASKGGTPGIDPGTL